MSRPISLRSCGVSLGAGGLVPFLLGLNGACSPLGRLMAEQLTDPAFIQATTALARSTGGTILGLYIRVRDRLQHNHRGKSLIAVAMKANEVSGGAISISGLRISVALGWRSAYLWAVTASWWATRSTGTSSAVTCWWSCDHAGVETDHSAGL